MDNYPPGVSNEDFAAEEPVCVCGHLADDHDPDGCHVCSCTVYEPQEG